MRRFSIGLAIFVSSFLVAAKSAAQTANFDVYGIAYEQQTSGYYYASNYQMKWCRMDNTYRCGYGYTDLYGHYLINIDPSYGSGIYYCYLWKDSTYWGSDSYPVGWASLSVGPVGNNMNGSVISTPRALPSLAVNPANGAVNVGQSFTLQWTDGLDSARRSPNWPVTYDIYASGNGAPEILEFSSIPCNGFGTCSVTVNGGLGYSVRWKWRVVARMHSQGAVWNAGDPTFYTDSGSLTFSTGWDPSIPLHNIRTSGNYYLRAVGGGVDNGDHTGNLDAAGTSDTYETEFQFVDYTSGSSTVYSGDQISFRSNRSFFISALYGGGYGVNLHDWANGYETWTIIRLAGPGYISPGDQVAFQSAYGWYMTAEGGGGGTVNSNRTVVGPWETFTFN